MARITWLIGVLYKPGVMKVTKLSIPTKCKDREQNHGRTDIFGAAKTIQTLTAITFRIAAG
jgi:hypothetical protein